MRVTANTFPNSLVDQLATLAERQNRVQNQISTGKRIQSPDDDPATTRRVIDLKSESQALAQYQSNIAALTDQGNAMYGAMKALKQISDRAGEIATLADGSKSTDELKAYATELNQLIQQGAQLANTKFRGDYLFAGTATSQAPFTVTTDANGIVTKVDYQGNASVAQTEIGPADTMSVQVPGANTTNNGPRGLLADSRFGADFFQHLIDLQNNLQQGNVAEIAKTGRGNLAKDEDNFIYQYGAYSAAQGRLQTTASRASDKSLDLDKSISEQTDVDLAQAMIQLSTVQNSYRAALQSGATLLNTSLLDYLR